MFLFRLKHFTSLMVFLLAGCGTPPQHDGEVIEVGWLDRSLFERPDLSEFHTGYDTVHVSTDFIPLLREANTGFHVLVFLGTWCSDSKREVPHFLKIADSIGIPPDHLRFYGLDKTKKSSDGLTDRYAITNVPTFIFLKNDKEIGRITESPQATLEGDILTIFVASRTP